MSRCVQCETTADLWDFAQNEGWCRNCWQTLPEIEKRDALVAMAPTT